MEKTNPRPELITVFEYLCIRTCFYEGKRWLAGSRYVFNQELKGVVTSHFEPLREKKMRAVPSDELEFQNVGRELNRPSEYETEYTGEIE
jgi:hypothetical protein